MVDIAWTPTCPPGHTSFSFEGGAAGSSDVAWLPSCPPGHTQFSYENSASNIKSSAPSGHSSFSMSQEEEIHQLRRLHMLELRANTNKAPSPVKAASKPKKEEPKKEEPAAPFQPGHFHYLTCVNDTDARWERADCDCEARKGQHSQTLEALATQSAGRTLTTVRSTSVNHCRGVFVGSGSDGMQDQTVCNAILELAAKSFPGVPRFNVLYIGTPTYDCEAAKERQTRRLAEAGANIMSCDVGGLDIPPRTDLVRKFAMAHIIVVSGGNTLYAVDCWQELKISDLLAEARDRGAVLCGGSCGAICWFDAGHSDSADPTSFREEAQGDLSDEDRSGWKYLRVPCLGFLPGLVCPHYDKKQSNGVLRAVDFDEMMIRHSGERGIGIDHWAALVVDDTTYRVLSVPGEHGSVMPDGSFGVGGSPGVWKLEVSGGKVIRSIAPAEGEISSLLAPAKRIVLDPLVEDTRSRNPLALR